MLAGASVRSGDMVAFAFSAAVPPFLFDLCSSLSGQVCRALSSGFPRGEGLLWGEAMHVDGHDFYSSPCGPQDKPHCPNLSVKEELGEKKLWG